MEKDKHSNLLSLIFALLATGYIYTTSNTNLLIGTIQFPANLEKTPLPRIYYGGRIMLRNAHNEAKIVTFSIQKIIKTQPSFYLLITSEPIEYKLKNTDQVKHNNIVDYLKIPPKQSYKLYSMVLVQDMFDVNNHNKEKIYRWNISNTCVPEKTGRIPDNTIIICYPAEYIDKIEGGNAFELPTIFIKPNIIDLAGSEEKLKETSNTLLFASFALDAIHIPVKQKIKRVDTHTLVAQTG